MEDLKIGNQNYLIYRDNLIKGVQDLYRSVDATLAHPNSKPFNPLWRTTGTIIQFCRDVIADRKAIIGNVYAGELKCSDLPAGLTTAKARIDVLQGSPSKYLMINIVSYTVAPYQWQQSYYSGNLSGWKSWTTVPDDIDPGDSIVYKRGYLGVANNYTDIMNSDYYYDTIVKGTPIQFQAVSEYVWAVFPAEYDVVVSMSLIKVPMILYDVIRHNNETYKVWKSIETQTGTFKLFLL